MGDIRAWLETHGLGKYVEVFVANEIERGDLELLSDADLQALGLPMGPRKRLLSALQRRSVPAPAADGTEEGGKGGDAGGRAGGAERRQLTVVFCDLVDSTALSSRLDPEDMRRITLAYQDACRAVIEGFGGFVARYMGDGLLAYFGYPRASENDAECAVLAGLGVVDAVRGLPLSPETALREPLRTRVGIATGSVVVGDLIGEGVSRESAVVGDAPNRAARLQGLAQPDQVVIDADTRSVVGGRFDCADMGRVHLKGFDAPVPVWHVVGVSAAESRFEARHGSGVTPLVGRQLEMDVLGERWGRAREGEGQVVFLVGEAGIGKSRLADALFERVAAEPVLRLRHQCSPHHGDSALHPVIERLARACGFSSRDAPEMRLGKLESLLSEEEGGGELRLPLIASLLAIPLDARYAPLSMTPDQQKEATLEVLVEQVITHADREPVLLLYEDVHWADATSQELLARLVEQIADVAVLLVVTSRPDFSPPWLDHAAVTTLTLSRIGPPLALELVDHVASGRTLPEEVRAQIISRADGVPLFVEELTKAVLESGQLEEQADRYVLSDPLGPVTIPSTLHASLLARLDRLARVREVAQLAAVIGREFSRELLVAVCDLDPVELAGGIERLIDSGLVFRRGAPANVWYVFKHALVRDAAYESLLKSRRRELHGRIAAELEERFPRVGESEPELLAHHFTVAGRAEPAVAYWLAAGRRAAERAAYTEAVAHLTRGLSLVEGLPEGPGRVLAEVGLRVALGVPLMKHRTVSSPEVGENYRRARQLTEAIGDDRQRFPVLWGQWYHNMLSFEVRQACEVADELLNVGRTLADESFELEAHHCQWASRFLAGEQAASLERSDRGVELYRAEAHHRLMFVYGGHDPGVCAHDVGALSLWLMGHSEQSQVRMAHARELARDLGQSSTLANCISKSLMLASFLCDLDAITTFGQELLAYTRGEWAEQSRPHALAVLGWVAFERGFDAQGLRQMRDAVASGLLEDPWNVHSVSLVAAALARAGAADEALKLIEEVISLSRRNGVGWWLPELLRVRGEVLRRRFGDGLEEAQASCWQAFEAARTQGATALQLRAAVSLQRGAAGSPGDDGGDPALAVSALLSSASRPVVMEATSAVERLS